MMTEFGKSKRYIPQYVRDQQAEEYRARRNRLCDYMLLATTGIVMAAMFWFGF